MSLISQGVPNLINGVSQQPFTLRLASQAEEQINALSSVVSGLQKRPGTRTKAKFRSTPLSNAHIHTINRDSAEQYIAVIASGDLAVYDLNGVAKTVRFPQGKAYLAGSNPEDGFACVTVADYTFVVNKNVTVTEGTEIAPARPFEGLIWVRQGAYRSTYKIAVDGKEATYGTMDSAADPALGPAHTIQTTVIAENLAQNIRAAGLRASIEISVIGSTIHFKSSTDFAMATYDPLGDGGLELVKGAVQRFSDLPARAVNGMKIRVAGTDTNAFDDYWVEYEAVPSNPFGGIWKESVAPGTRIKLSDATMPHLLVRDADGTFSFEEAVFDPRPCGDLESNPWPSFLTRKINDVFFHRNRLGFLSDENVIFSQAGEFFKFFRSSAIQTLDTDPVDVAVSHVKVSVLKAAVPFNETLMLFSDQSQFQLAKADVLAPRTIGINLATEFSCNTRARPVGVGTNIYFAQSRGGVSGIREYYTDPDTSANDATDVTAHCPRYIPGDVRKLTASSNENMLVALSTTLRRTLFVYRFYWARQEKLQSSWSKWVFPANTTILDCEFIANQLVLITSRPDGCYIETIPLEEGLTEEGTSYQFYLDRRLNASQLTGRTYDAEANTSTFTGFVTPQPGEEWVAVTLPGDASYRPGQVLPVTFNGSKVVVPGNASRFYLGVRFEMRYTLSPFVMREQAPGGQGLQAVNEGRLQIRRLSVSYSTSSYFRAEVTPQGRDRFTYPFSGKVLGSASNVIGTMPAETGTFHFPVVAKNDQVKIELVNDSPFPSNFLSAEWEGFFTIRSRRS